MPRTKLPVAPVTDEFLDLRGRLADWRRSRRQRARLPEEIWTAAVELARRHGVYRTACALPIDYAGLRKRLEGGARPTAVARPQFLEVLLPPAQSGNCVELMRVPFSGAVDWNRLFRAWRGQ
jgi:hypothetical protein